MTWRALSARHMTWRASSGRPSGEDRQASSASPAADAEFSAERTAAMEALGHEADIYDRLVSSLAPSIWEMEAGAYTRPLLNSTSALFVGYVGYLH